uniref:Nudix hydrolase domain-containing protein n=1 Tax=viral metagenome TaxID=1070528 RepID=A0A6C0JTX7_9ZZZZ
MNEKQIDKFVYSKDGYKLYAGGVLFYDQNGIWIIKEYFRDNYRFSDIGGKYSFEDCNIYSTISREFCEETYYSFPFTYFKLIELLRDNKCEEVYICSDSQNNPTYLSLLIDVKDINFELSAQEFNMSRNKVINENPKIPVRHYSSFELFYLKFEDVEKYKIFFNFRLKQLFNRTKFLRKHLIKTQKINDPLKGDVETHL